MKQIFITFLALSFTFMCKAQLAVDNKGNACVGDRSCFWGFGSDPIPTEWSTVNAGTFSVGGEVSIAFYDNGDDYWGLHPFSIAPAMKKSGVSYTSIFYVTREGTAYCRGGVVQLSDSTMKTNISPLTSTLSKIQTLNGISYDLKDDIENTRQQKSPIKNSVLSKRIGLLAQDVEKVYPEVIRTFTDGSKGIMYTDLIAVLIEGMKELNDSLMNISVQYANLQNRVDSLQEQLRILMQNLSPQTRAPKQNSESYIDNSVKEAALYQNVPNPFNQITEISYRLSSNARTAVIGVYDLNGKLIENYPLPTNVIAGKIQINAFDFEPGMYIYALIMDGAMIDSKRMILNH